jgi:thymidine phosphorylase
MAHPDTSVLKHTKTTQGESVMLTTEIIIKRRNRHHLDESEIREFITGVTNGTVSEGQIAAFCMTAFLNPMNDNERVALTRAMAQSGDRLDWSQEHLDGPVLDKHSTGGIGDKVSLMLAPIIAACGGYVPMISGRGLGHTGGTLDKMDSIPGYITQPDIETFKSAVRQTRCAIIGATANLAPADKRIYAVRDISGTVESLDLITASILSKKMAAGLDALVMDVKFGNGAFMQDYDDARKMAETIVNVANLGGLPCVALMTDMNQVLGKTAGNAVEVLEAISFLKNEDIDQRLYDVTMELCAELLVLGKLAATIEDARKKCNAALHSGQAAEFFARMVAALGGPADLLDRPGRYIQTAPMVREIHAGKPGFVTAINTRQIGLAVIELGGGRRVATDTVDHGVGLTGFVALGTKTGPDGPPLCTIHARDADSLARAETMIRAAITIGDSPLETAYPVREKIFSIC